MSFLDSKCAISVPWRALMCTYCVKAVTREVCRICTQPSTTLKCFTWPIMSMIFVFSLTQMSVVLYLYVMLSIHISFFPFWYVGLQVCSVLVLVSVHFCIICHSWQHTGVTHMSLQADGKIAFEEIPVFGVCRPA